MKKNLNLFADLREAFPKNPQLDIVSRILEGCMDECKRGFEIESQKEREMIERKFQIEMQNFEGVKRRLEDNARRFEEKIDQKIQDLKKKIEVKKVKKG